MKKLLLSLLLALPLFGVYCSDDSSSDDVAVVSAYTISGVTVPAVGENPVTQITATDQYTGTVSWTPAHTTFEAQTTYTATITLTAKSGYTLDGVSASSFTVAGATVTYNSTTGVLTAVFPATGSTEVTFENADTAGQSLEVTEDGVTFRMVYVPGGLTFPTGTANNGIATVTNAYFIADTEVTYELWQKVYDWAVSGTGGATGEGQYTFANSGSSPGTTNPVADINWRDAIVWCNALTEWYNAQKSTNLACVYYTDANYQTPLRTATNDETDANVDGTLDNFLVPGSEDKPYIKASTNDNTDITNCTAKGFRIFTNEEYELAARYRGTDTTYTVTGTISGTDFDAMGIKWTKGDAASGDSAIYSSSATLGNYTWNTDNGGGQTHAVGTAGNSGGAVRSGNANTLNIFDMSGNIREWSFTPIATKGKRNCRGGAVNYSANGLRVGHLFDGDMPYVHNNSTGFRFVRTK